jgi:hypothetical protein
MAEITIDIGARRVVHAGQHYDAAMSGDEPGAGVFADLAARRCRWVTAHASRRALATRYLNLMHELFG